MGSSAHAGFTSRFSNWFGRYPTVAPGLSTYSRISRGAIEGRDLAIGVGKSASGEGRIPVDDWCIGGRIEPAHAGQKGDESVTTRF
jgi:hypothetical protein